jgi:hypothetical protein
MDNQPSVDCDFLIPILIGGLFMWGSSLYYHWAQPQRTGRIAATPSSTPFQYIYLGTEPAITTLVVEGSDSAAPTDEPVEESPGFVTPTRQSFSTRPLHRLRLTAAPPAVRALPRRAATATRTSTPLPRILMMIPIPAHL